MTISPTELWKRIADCHLASAQDCRVWAAEIAELAGPQAIGDVDAIVDCLIRTGKLTAYQASALRDDVPERLTLGPFIIQELVDRRPFQDWKVAKQTRSNETSWLYVIDESVIAEPAFASNPPSIAQCRKQTRLHSKHLQRFTEPTVFDQAIVLACEPLSGDSLENVPRVTWQQSVTLIQALVQAVTVLHQANVVHGSIDLGRVWQTADGQIVLIRDPLFPTTSPLVTPFASCLDEPAVPNCFAAPEFLVPSQNPTTQTDLYALGCLWFQLLTGSAPFESLPEASRMEAHASRPLMLPEGLSVPQPIQSCLNHLVAKNPRARFATIQQFDQALAQALRESKLDPNEAGPMPMFGSLTPQPKPIATRSSTRSPATAAANVATSVAPAKKVDGAPPNDKPAAPKAKAVDKPVEQPIEKPAAIKPVVENASEARSTQTRQEKRSSEVAPPENRTSAPAMKPKVESPKPDKPAVADTSSDRSLAAVPAKPVAVPKRVEEKPVEVKPVATSNQTSGSGKSGPAKPVTIVQAVPIDPPTTKLPDDFASQAELLARKVAAQADVEPVESAPRTPVEVPPPATTAAVVRSEPSSKTPSVPTNVAATETPKPAATTAPQTTPTPIAPPVAAPNQTTSTPASAKAAGTTREPAPVAASAAAPVKIAASNTESVPAKAATSKPTISKASTGTKKKSTAGSKTKKSTRGKRKAKRPVWFVPALFGGAALALVVLVVVFLQKPSGSKENVAKNDTSTEPVSPNGTEERSNATKAEPTNPIEEQFIVQEDDGSLPWTPPHASQQYSIELIPPSVQGLVFLRPSAWLESPEGLAIVDIMESDLADLWKNLESVAGVPPSEIREVAISLFSGESGWPSYAYRIELKEKRSLSELKDLWNKPTEEAIDSKYSLLVSGDRAYYVSQQPLVDASSIQTFAVGPKQIMTDLVELKGAVAPQKKQIEELLRETDHKADLTVVIAPNFLFTDATQVLSTYAPTIVDELQSLFGTKIRGGLLTTTLAPQWYVEFRLKGESDQEAGQVLKDIKDRMTKLDDHVEATFVESPAHPYWRGIANRFPQMLRSLQKYQRFSVENGQVISNFYLPSTAAPNLIFASWMAVQKPLTGSVVVKNPNAPASTKPLTLEDMLDRPITIAFDQESLEVALQSIAEEANRGLPEGTKPLPMEIVSAALERDGITRNQQIRDFKHKNAPLRSVLLDLVMRANPIRTVKVPTENDQKLVWMLSDDPKTPGSKIVQISTRRAATEGKLTLPKEFAPAP